MLTAGSPVIDLLYLDGTETQVMIRKNGSRLMTSLGKCDVIPDDLLLEQLNVQPGGRVGLANGMSYAVLSVANQTIDTAALQKIVQLINQGATVWFRKAPETADASYLNELGANRPAGIYTVGKGKIILGDMPVKEMFARIGLTSAFAYTPDDGQPFLDYNQRKEGDTDIFFVANWKDSLHRAECEFRVEDKQPEFWDPVNGQISPCTQYQAEGGITRLRLELPPYGSTFVVFRKKSEGGRSQQLPLTAVPDKQSVITTTTTGPWHIEFQPERKDEPKFEITSPALFLWNESAEARVKSFSGTASYQTVFEVNPNPKIENWKYILDLGIVHDLAEVIVNGTTAGVVWTAPFGADLTKLLKPGKNTLEIRVVNTWHNWRLANKFVAGAHPWEKFGLSLPPAPAGLVGPVTLNSYPPA
jgi:hypothetical protein